MDGQQRPQSVVRIRQFASADTSAVAELFTEGMCSYAGHQNAYNLQYIASCLQEDLADIQASYIATGGNFWVATLPAADPSGDELVVGMVGIRPTANGDAELRRLAVKHGHQGLGIGRLLATHLEAWARANGFMSVSLSTGTVMPEAIAFYTKCGYTYVREEIEADVYLLACFAKEL